MGGALTNLRAPKVAPGDDQSIVSLTPSQKSMLDEINGIQDPDEQPATPNAYIFPPMPFMGSTIDIRILDQRNIKCEKNFKDIVRNVMMDTKNMIEEVKAVPVSDATSKQLVSMAISERMNQIRTRKQIRLAREANINKIQQVLTARMRTHEIMNMNSSKVLVNKIEPIFIKEARGQVIHLDEQPEEDDEEDG